MIEWLWWSSWLLFAYAAGCKNGYGIGEINGYWACAKAEHDVLCAAPHSVGHMTPCMEARLKGSNPWLRWCGHGIGPMRCLSCEDGLAESRGPC